MLLFHVLYRVLGAVEFDRAYRDFFQSHRNRGGTTADLVAAFERASNASGPIFDDWLLTTRWRSKLSAGATIDQLVETYRTPAAPK
jgi:aminopeptidase N